MSEDQRFAVGRPDFLTFTTDILIRIISSLKRPYQSQSGILHQNQ